MNIIEYLWNNKIKIIVTKIIIIIRTKKSIRTVLPYCIIKYNYIRFELLKNIYIEQIFFFTKKYLVKLLIPNILEQLKH